MSILVSVCFYCCAAVLVLVPSSLFDSGGSRTLSGSEESRQKIRDRLGKDTGRVTLGLIWIACDLFLIASLLGHPHPGLSSATLLPS